jgi:ABC-type dipeptide/oligopeptide/nickel transport system ATPase subunit
MPGTVQIVVATSKNKWWYIVLLKKGLGFEPEDSNRLCSDFSGGWQMRIALARYVHSSQTTLRSLIFCLG